MPGEKGMYSSVFGEEPIVNTQNVEANKDETSASQPEQKLIPRTAEAQGLTQGRNIIDVAELKGLGNSWNRNRLRERGFSYQDSNTGDIISVDANSLSRRDFRKLANRAAREERFARRFGIGDTTGWSQDAINLRKQQVGNDFRYTTLNPAEQTPAAEQQAQSHRRTWNYNLQNAGWTGGNEFYGKTAEGLIQALYANKQYDILDALSDGNGNITYDSMKNYQAGLGTGEEFASGNYGKETLKAMLDKQYITQEQYNRLYNGLGTPVVPASAPASAPATTSVTTPVSTSTTQAPAVAASAPVVQRPAVDWIQNAKAAGFGVGLNEAASNYNDLLLGRVASWQQAHGLTADSKFGNASRARLGATQLGQNDFNANGEYIGAKALPQLTSDGKYSISAGHYTGNFPNEWRTAGLNPQNVNFRLIKPGGLFSKGYGYWEVTPEIAEKINTYYSTKHKQGGKLMNYFQQGGSIAAQQIAQEQAQQQRAQLDEIFMAIAKNPKETLMALQKQGVQPKDVIALAQKMAETNPAAKQALAALAQMAKDGAKLQYIKRLRGECPEGYEAVSYKIGGKVCKKCEKIEAEKCGGKAKKAKKCEDGGESPIVSEFKEFRCGGKAKKAKKCEDGGEAQVTSEFKCGGKSKKAKKCEIGGEAPMTSELKCGGKAKKAKKCEEGGTAPLVFEFKCGGKSVKPKTKKCENGGESPVVTEFKELRCGGKAKTKKK